MTDANGKIIEIVSVAKTDVGFSATFERRENVFSRTSQNFPDILRGMLITVPAALIAELDFSAFVTTDKQLEVISGAFSTLSVKVYQLSALPNSLSGLPTVWEEKFFLPYDNNRFSATSSKIVKIPLSAGTFFVLVGLSDSALIQEQTSNLHLIFSESVQITGVPATSTAEFYTSTLTSISTLTTQMQSLATLLQSQVTAIAALSTTMIDATTQQVAAMRSLSTQIQAASGVIDYSASLAAIKTDIETLHTDLSGL